ncbi:MAG: hypothetical protein RIQ48_442 [Pseudomonadota bacterium]|jgi:hypothetical protein
MTKYAMIQTKKVINIIEAESEEIVKELFGEDGYVEIQENELAHIGLKYTPEDGFEQPEPPVVILPKKPDAGNWFWNGESETWEEVTSENLIN